MFQPQSARYLSFSPDDPEENEKIWRTTKAAHEADPIRIGATTSLDVSYSFADSAAIIAMDYPELEIISWEFVTPLGVVVRCSLHGWKDLRNCYSDPVDLMGHYAILSSSCSLNMQTEHSPPNHTRIRAVSQSSYSLPKTSCLTGLKAKMSEQNT